MSFCNYFAALRLLAAGADNVACDLIRSSDMTRHSDVVEAVSADAKVSLPPPFPLFLYILLALLSLMSKRSLSSIK